MAKKKVILGNEKRKLCQRLRQKDTITAFKTLTNKLKEIKGVMLERSTTLKELVKNIPLHCFQLFPTGE